MDAHIATFHAHRYASLYARQGSRGEAFDLYDELIRWGRTTLWFDREVQRLIAAYRTA